MKKYKQIINFIYIIPYNKEDGIFKFEVWKSIDYLVKISYINHNIYPANNGVVIGYDNYQYLHKHHFKEVCSVDKNITFQELINLFINDIKVFQDIKFSGIIDDFFRETINIAKQIDLKQTITPRYTIFMESKELCLLLKPEVSKMKEYIYTKNIIDDIDLSDILNISMSDLDMYLKLLYKCQYIDIQKKSNGKNSIISLQANKKLTVYLVL